MTAVTAPRSLFDIRAELPEGTTVLEASAGTGKTWTIAALATRYLAEGKVTLDRLLLITFTRAASSELRARVRGQLVAAHEALRDPRSAREQGSPLIRLLAGGDDAEVAVRRQRLGDALASFDQATIATTHTFCLRMLSGLGIAGDHDPQAEVADDLAELRDRCIDDVYLRMCLAGRLTLSRKEAGSLATDALGAAGSRLEPGPDSPLQARRFVDEFRAEFAARKRAARVLDYDDLQVLLAAALSDPDTGPRAVALLRSQYHLVMVDEFQDTDQVQWRILLTAFHGSVPLLLIGDPKQAIYAFRGGDINTYLQATAQADHRFDLTTNYRSDGPLVAAIAALFGVGPDASGSDRGELALGEAAITLRETVAAQPSSRLSGAGAPLRLNFLHPDDTPSRVAQTRELLIPEIVRDIARLTASGAVLTVSDEDGVSHDRPLAPGDIAVLVNRNADAAALRSQLADLGVPAVLASTESVFGSEAAEQWRTALRALESPQSAPLFRAFLVSAFVGWKAVGLATADDLSLNRELTRLRVWSTLLAERGVAAAFEAISAETNLPARLLSQPGGDRLLTDLRHIGELLFAEARDHGLGVSGLLSWLRDGIARADRGDSTAERSRRLATDRAAVQVLTVHRAKGLEYPVVYVPFAWDNYVNDPPTPLIYQDEAGQRVVDLAPDNRANPAGLTAHRIEAAGEELRKLYVALTRAGSQLVCYWANSSNTPASGLHRVLMGQRDVHSQLPARVAVNWSEVGMRLAALNTSTAGLIHVERINVNDTTVATQPVSSPADEIELDVRRFSRELDRAWRRTSYSGLTAAAHEIANQTPGAKTPSSASSASEQDEVLIDEPDVQATSPTGQTTHPAALVPSPLTGFEGGTSFGTLVHEVLERSDLAGETAAGLRRECRRAVAVRGGGIDADALAQALLSSVTTPLAPTWPELTLATVESRDRLVELDFELPLAGGDRGSDGTRDSTVGSTLSDLGEAWASTVRPGDPLAAYPQRLIDGLPGDALRGYLTGSIDAVVRLPERQGFLVIDYKTNRLGPPGVDLTAWDYRPTALAEAMMAAHYPLQALLYSVALHRFLRWRLPGYDPDKDLAGCAYLFLRGMCGPAAPLVDGASCGVFSWQPGSDLILATSDLLAGRRPR